MAEEWVTLRHRDHGGTAEFPELSADAWKALGWEQIPETTDETPPEPQPARRQKDKE